MLTKTCIVPKDPTAMGAVISAFKINKDAPKNRLLRLRSILTVQSKTNSFGEWKGAYSEGSQASFVICFHNCFFRFCNSYEFLFLLNTQKGNPTKP